MRRATLFLFLSCCVLPLPSLAQDYPYHLAVVGTFTTSSKLFHHPDDPDQTLRDQFLPLDDIFSIGLDLRRTLEPGRIEIGLSVEYLRKTEDLWANVQDSVTVPVSDGFTAIPVEASGYFIIPVGTSVLHVYMGGGVGAYYGTRHYEIAGMGAATTEEDLGFGIHVLSGLEYALGPRVSLRSEVKFRDIQFRTVNQFSTGSATYGNSSVTLDRQPMPSRIAIDGMTLNLGLVYHF